MCRFKSGKFNGKTMEHAMLRSAPRLYWTTAWAEEQAEEKPRLRPLVREFNRLRELLRDAPVDVACQGRGCKRKPRWMTFTLDWVEHYLRPGPSFWCDTHNPPRDEDEDDESQKMLIHFDALSEYKDKRSQRAIHLGVLEALGIKKKPPAITEDFAGRFFAKLPS